MMTQEDLKMLADIILNVWAGGSENANDFVDQEEEPERWAYITQLAMEHSDTIQELAYNGGVERLIIDHLKKGGLKINVRYPDKQ